MLEFCPHCGQLHGLVKRERALVCTHCGKQVEVDTPVERVVIDATEQLVRQGRASRCAQCGQLVELRGKTLPPHYAGAARKVCPGSGKTPDAAVAAPPVVRGKDLEASMTREAIRVVSCRRGAAPRIEELALAYLDKNDRVRLHIEALRDVLGPSFRMVDYPPSLGRPAFALWTSDAMCVVGKKHPQGGCQPMSDTELAQVVTDLQQHPTRFFA